MVAALTILSQGSPADCLELLSILDRTETGDERWQGLVAALALHRRPGLDGLLGEQLEHRVSRPRLAAVVHALARRRADLGDRLTTLLRDDDPAVLAAAATFARRGDAAQLQLTAALAEHADGNVVRAAVETAWIRELPGAAEAIRYWAFDSPEYTFRRAALIWIALSDDLGDHERLLALIDDPSLRRDALWAASFCGRALAVDAALPYLGDAVFGPLAAEVFTGVAGLPSEDESLWRDVAEVASDDETLPPLADDDLDADLGLDPERLLPIPEPDAVARWWHARRSSLDSGRWIAGEILDSDSLLRALRNHPLRRRHVLGLLAQRRSHAAWWPRTHDWAHAQLRQL